MQTKPAVSVPFDLSSLPDGFLRTVEREFSPKNYRDAHEALLWALSEAWARATAKQRHSAQDGVNQTLRSLLADHDPAWGSYAAGVIGARCLDLAMDFVDVSELDPAAVLRGVQDAGGVRVNNAIAGLIDSAINQAPAPTLKVDSIDLLAVTVDARTIRLPDERRDLEDGIRQAFRARPQRGTWSVSVVGENYGHSDRYAFAFSRAGAGGGAVLYLGTLVCNISDLHNGGAIGGSPRDRLIAEVRASIDLWLRERGTPAPTRAESVRPSGNIVEFVTEPDTSLANARKRDVTHMVDMWLANSGIKMAEVKLAFVQGTRWEVDIVEAWGRRTIEEEPVKITDLVRSILKLEADRNRLPKRLGFVRVCALHDEEPMRDYFWCSACMYENPPVYPGADPARDYWEITEEEWEACIKESANRGKRRAILVQSYKLIEGTLNRPTI